MASGVAGFVPALVARWMLGRNRRARGVAGVRPRPSLRDDAADPADRELGVAGVRARPLLRVQYAICAFHSHRRCRGSARPSLRGPVLQCYGTTWCGLAGVPPGPRCACSVAAPLRAGVGVAGFGPGPRCAEVWLPRRLGATSDLAGAWPGPRCANLYRSGLVARRAALPGSPRPSLRAGMRPSDRRQAVGVAGFVPPSLRVRPENHARAGSYGSVAGFTRPSLRAVSADLDPGGQRGVAGLDPGPRCAHVDHDPRLIAPRRRRVRSGPRCAER